MEQRKETQSLVNVDHPTTKQMVAFTVLLSFIVSIIGTILTIGVFGPLSGAEDIAGGAVLFNKPRILEKVTEVVLEKEVSERVLRQEDVIVEIVERAAQAVVGIQLYRENTDDPQVSTFVETGSGFLVSSDGMVLTAGSVLPDPEARYAVVFAGGRSATATVSVIDQAKGVAVLKAEVSEAPHLALSETAARSGQTAIAIGRGTGAMRAISVGIVSGFTEIASSTRIATDMRVETSSVGGPVLDLTGAVIGILAAPGDAADLHALAIPVSDARDALTAPQGQDATGD